LVANSNGITALDMLSPELKRRNWGISQQNSKYQKGFDLKWRIR
jgi:hypothetical protein